MPAIGEGEKPQTFDELDTKGIKIVQKKPTCAPCWRHVSSILAAHQNSIQQTFRGAGLWCASSTWFQTGLGAPFVSVHVLYGAGDLEVEASGVKAEAFPCGNGQGDVCRRHQHVRKLWMGQRCHDAGAQRLSNLLARQGGGGSKCMAHRPAPGGEGMRGRPRRTGTRCGAAGSPPAPRRGSGSSPSPRSRGGPPRGRGRRHQLAGFN